MSHDEGATHRRRPACNACRSCLSHGLSPSTTSRMQITHPPSHTTTSSSERWCCHWTLLSHGYFLSSTILFIFAPTTLCNACQNCCKVLFQACLLLSLHLHRMLLSLTTCINQDVEHITSTSIDWSHFTSSLQGARALLLRLSQRDPPAVHASQQVVVICGGGGGVVPPALSRGTGRRAASTSASPPPRSC